MKNIILGILFTISFNVYATESVKIYSPYSPGHSATPAMLKIIDEANSSQNTYKFTLEFKPGGNQVIAVKSLDNQNLQKSRGEIIRSPPAL